MTVELVTPGEITSTTPSPDNTKFDECGILRRSVVFIFLLLFLVDVSILVLSATLYAGHSIDRKRLDPAVTLYHLATSFIPLVLVLDFILMMIFLRWFRTGAGMVPNHAAGCGIPIYILMTVACVAFFAVFVSMCRLDMEFQNLPYEPPTFLVTRTNNITLHDMNNVHGQIEVGESTVIIRFLGSYNTSDACIKACDDYTLMYRPSSSCHSWTWHYPVSQNYQYAGQCFGRTDLVWEAEAQTYVDCGIATNGGGVETYIGSVRWTGAMFRDMLQTNHYALALYVLLVVRLGIPVVVPVGLLLWGLIKLILWAKSE